MPGQARPRGPAAARAAGPQATLPGRWRPWQRRKNTLIWRLLRATVAALRWLPHPVRDALARLFGHLAHAVAWPQRRLAGRQMQAAMPELAERQRARHVRGMFVHLARACFELLDLPRLLRTSPLDGPSRDVLVRALGQGRGVVAISAHLGNWELLAQAVAHAGLPITLVARSLYDPRLTAWMEAERRRYGAELLWRGEAGSARALLRTLRDNRILALLIDQDTRVDGMFAPFFHRPAHTPRAAAALALRDGTPVVFAHARRTQRGHAYSIEAVDVASIVAGVPASEQAAVLTAAFNARIERAVRAHPDQWVWLHDRWRRTAAARPERGRPEQERADAGQAAATASPAEACRRAGGTRMLGLMLAIACLHGGPVPAGAAATREGPPASAGPANTAQPKARAPATQARRAPNAAKTNASANAQPDPRHIDFRCERMQVDERSHTGTCTGNVVLREGNMLLCCDSFRGEADASWQWQRFVCTGNVAIAQGQEGEQSAAWAQQATGELAAGVVTLRGEPVLQRGLSLLVGDEVRLLQASGSAEIIRPRGHMHTAAAKAAAAVPGETTDLRPPWQDGPLPQHCPLPKRPAP